MDRRRSLLKIAALRTEREHQQGVDASKGYLETTSEGLFFEGPRTLECYFNFQHADKEQLPAEYAISMMGFELSRSDYLAFHCGGNNVQVPLTVGNDYHAVISYNGSNAKCYLNGNLVGTVIPRSYVVVSQFRIGALNYPPTGYVYFCRHYNYALSAEEVAALYNDGDPAGYVLPVPYKFKVADYISDFSKNADGWFVPSSYPGVSINAGDGILSVSGDSTTLVIQNQNMASGDKASIFRVRITFAVPFTGSIVRFFAHSYNYYADLTLSSDKLNAEGIVYINEASNSYNVSYMYSYDVPIGDVVKLQSITIESIGSIAEYLPQNILVSRKRDFPPVTFPISTYTPSNTVYKANLASTTKSLFDQPQANGFSGDFMRFEAITAMSLYNAYWYSHLKKSVPIKVTFEYRSSQDIYEGLGSANKGHKIADANEGNAKTATAYYPNSIGNQSIGFGETSSLSGEWLEMRVLSIEVAEGVCLKWYDSAKQLPLNDEYLPPLLESDGGYDLTAVGTPEIIIE